MPIATSFEVLNYSGRLFNRGNTKTPLSTAIGGHQEVTNHAEFLMGQEYTSASGEQPKISETASLTAPDATVVKREGQTTNVTQIFQYRVGVSYGKMSNMGTLAPANINIANQTANPMNELDFQVNNMLIKAQQDIEYTFINGVYAKATTDAEANQTRGLVPAITTSVKDMAGSPLSYWDVVELIAQMEKAGADTSNLILVLDRTQQFQLNADAEQYDLQVVPASYNVNGINIMTLLTPFGNINMMIGKYLPAGTALLLNLDAISPVIQPVPGKGNFFLEPLAKTGAGTEYQLFGQIGLDYSREWLHGKFTNISTDFEKPKWSKSVYIAGQATSGTTTTTTTSGS